MSSDQYYQSHGYDYQNQNYDYSTYASSSQKPQQQQGYYDPSTGQYYYYDPSLYAQSTNYTSSNYQNYTTAPVSTPVQYPTVTPGSSGQTSDTNRKKDRAKRVIRSAGGEVWEDQTLLEWDENDFRLFAGDLGPETTDEILHKAFEKYGSLQKAKVVRDNRTGKSKGYGFISFGNADDFVKAWREMNGKYVGNRPIKLRKSTWKDRNIDVKTKKERLKATGPYSR